MFPFFLLLSSILLSGLMRIISHLYPWIQLKILQGTDVGCSRLSCLDAHIADQSASSSPSSSAPPPLSCRCILGDIRWWVKCLTSMPSILETHLGFQSPGFSLVQSECWGQLRNGLSHGRYLRLSVAVSLRQIINEYRNSFYNIQTNFICTKRAQTLLTLFSKQYLHCIFTVWYNLNNLRRLCCVWPLYYFI